MCNHIILNGNLFGYPEGEMKGRFFRMVVMAADIHKGGDPTLIGYSICADGDKIKIPDSADYKRFGIAEPKERR